MCGVPDGFARPGIWLLGPVQQVQPLPNAHVAPSQPTPHSVSREFKLLKAMREIAQCDSTPDQANAHSEEVPEEAVAKGRDQTPDEVRAGRSACAVTRWPLT